MDMLDLLDAGFQVHQVHPVHQVPVAGAAEAAAFVGARAARPRWSFDDSTRQRHDDPRTECPRGKGAPREGRRIPYKSPFGKQEDYGQFYIATVKTAAFFTIAK